MNSNNNVIVIIIIIIIISIVVIEVGCERRLRRARCVCRRSA